MAFLEFLKELYDKELQYRPELAQQGGYAGPTPGPTPTPGGPMGSLLAQMQAGAQAGMPGRAGMPPLGGGSGPVNLAGRPDAGDLYDFNYSNGDPGLLGLFGSPDPVPLRRPPFGVNMRRPGRP